MYFHRFFKQYLLLLLLNQMASGLFRFMGALGRNIIVANTFGSFALVAVLVMGGFILSRSKFCLLLIDSKTINMSAMIDFVI